MPTLCIVKKIVKTLKTKQRKKNSHEKTANNVENVENVQETQNIEKEQVKVHYFRVPKDEKLRIDWQKAIQRTDLNLNYNQRVFHLHFLEKDIERKIVLKDRNGRIIQEVL